MKGKMFALVDSVRELTKEGRELSAEEVEKRDKMLSDVRAMEKDIAAEEEMQRIEAQKAKRSTDPEKDRAEWRSLGEFVSTIYTNPNDKRLRGREVELRQPPPQEMDTGAAGGFLVPEQFSSDLLTVQPDEAVVRPRATVFPGGGDADFHIPALQYSGENMYAGAEVDWIDEGEAKPETDVTFKRVTLHPFELAAHVRITDKLMRNAPAIEQIVRTQLRGALIDAEEEAFLVNAGAAANAPNPIIGAGATVVTARAAGNQVQYVDLVGMYSRFRGRRGVWIVSRAVIPELMQLQDGAGGLVWMPNARDGSPGSLLGMPVLYSDHSPDLGDQGDVVLADLSYYLIKDGIGVSMAISPHVHFVNNITVIKAFKTVDGTPWLTGVLPTTPTTSPFVALDA